MTDVSAFVTSQPAHHLLCQCTPRGVPSRSWTQLGTARHGSARLGSARLGSARLGSARLGSARLGSARLGAALRDKDLQLPRHTLQTECDSDSADSEALRPCINSAPEPARPDIAQSGLTLASPAGLVSQTLPRRSTDSAHPVRAGTGRARTRLWADSGPSRSRHGARSAAGRGSSHASPRGPALQQTRARPRQI